MWQGKTFRLETVLLVTTSVVVGMVFFVLLSVQAASTYHNLSQATRTFEQVISKLLLESIRQPLTQGSFVEAQQRLQQSVEDGRIACVDLKLSTFSLNDCRPDAHEIAWHDLNPTSTIPELAGYEGHLKIGFDNSAMNAELRKRIAVIALTSLGVALFAGLIIFMVFRFLRNEAQALTIKLRGGADTGSPALRTHEFALFAEKLEELIQTRASLHRSESFADLAKSVAHDMRSPLSTIKIAVEKLRRISQNPDIVSIIHLASERLNSIADGLLKRAMLVDRFTSRESFIDAVHRLIAEHEHHFPAGQIVLQDSTTSEWQIGMNTDDVVAVVDNCLRNSFEAKSDAHILCEVFSVDDRIIISIEDDGPGFRPDLISQIGHSRVSSKRTGTGFGTLLSAKKIDRAGGIFNVRNAPRGGAIVSIALPLRRPYEQP